jgi:hypothetical protein
MGDSNPNNLSPALRQRYLAFEADPWSRRNGVAIRSGYRSTARQWVLYNGWRRGLPGFNRAAYPGTSKHERTLNGRPAAEAVDIMVRSGDERGAQAVARRYGLHFPISGEWWHAEVNYAVPFRGGPPPAPPAPPPEEDDLKPDERAALLGVADALLNTRDPRNPGIVHFIKNEMRPQSASAHLILKQLQAEITGTQSDYWKRMYEVRDRLTTRTAKMLVRTANALLRRLDKPQDVKVEEIE